LPRQSVEGKVRVGITGLDSIAYRLTKEADEIRRVINESVAVVVYSVDGGLLTDCCSGLHGCTEISGTPRAPQQSDDT
jgi:hypothetical protein